MNRKHDAGVAKHIGTYSDAVEIDSARRIIYVSGTRVLTRTVATCRTTSPSKRSSPGATS